MAEPGPSPAAATPASEATTAEVGVDPTWYKDAVIYELHVRSFCDSTSDGTGDFPGLTSKLDYLRDLGVTALWLLPFYPSPLVDDGYDISDYGDVHPSYGTLREFKNFLREAHARGLRVIIELVLNHTSDRHWWFQRARRSAPGSVDREFYLWSDTPDKFTGARIIFQDFERSNWAWDPVAKAYYFHRFYSSQPDLNYDNPAVHRAILRTIDSWLEMGVDGLRLDAAPYLFKREGTNCENLPETHQFLRSLRTHVDERFPGRMLLAEANQWPEDAAAYFGSGRGDECHTAFHFPLMPRLFMATRMGSRFPIIDVLHQTPEIPADCQWLLFLRNHDELTLEMVSDEERDYMYRVYAHDPRMRLNLGIRRRLAPLLGNDRRLIELMNGLLFALPGTPVLYYGDEIGMGDNVYLGDRNGVRTPMQWSPDRNAGFSRANPQRLYLPVIIDPEFHYERVNVEVQEANPSSLLWHMKRLIALRRETRVFGRGTITFLYPTNARVLAFLRAYEGEQVLVVANLSHLAQGVDLDLAAYKGTTPVELFGRTAFPPVTDAPYRLTLAPFGFLWFRLEVPTAPHPAIEAAAVEPLALPERGTWESLESVDVRERLADHLPRYLRAQRWFRGKGLTIESATVSRILPFGGDPEEIRLALIEVHFSEAEPQTYLVPLAFADAGPPTSLGAAPPGQVLATFHGSSGGVERLLHDVAQDPVFVHQVVARIARNRRRSVNGGAEIAAVRTDAYESEETSPTSALPVTASPNEQSNSSSRIGDRYILKLFRLLEPGANPEVELGEFFARQPDAPVAPLAGHLDLRGAIGETATLASLHRLIPNEGDAWGLTLDHLQGYFDRARAGLVADTKNAPAVPPLPLDLAGGEVPPRASELVGSYLELARRLGAKTADFHRRLARETNDSRFAPEPFDRNYVRSILQRMQTLRQQSFELLRSARAGLPERVRSLADSVLARENEVDDRFRRLLGRRFSAQRIRVHGDFHLGQVLWTGKDFVLIDLEGEPLRPLSERRLKRSPLRDVAGMLRSFDYAASVSLRAIPVNAETGHLTRGSLLPLADQWVTWVSSSFLHGYWEASGTEGIVPKDPEERRLLLGAFVVEKAVYEVGYELNNRPSWVDIPLRGLSRLLDAERPGDAKGPA